MRVKVPFRYFVHGRARGERHDALHRFGETVDVEVPHVASTDRFVVLAPDLPTKRTILPVAHGRVWYPVTNVQDHNLQVTIAAEAQVAARAAAMGHQMEVPIRPARPPVGIPSSPENDFRRLGETILLGPDDRIEDRMSIASVTNRRIRLEQAIVEASDLAVVDDMLCTSRYEPLFKVAGLVQEASQGGLRCEMIWHDRRTGLRGGSLSGLTLPYAAGGDLASVCYVAASDLPAMLSIARSQTAGSRYDLRIVDLPFEELTSDFDVLDEIGPLAVDLVRATLSQAFHSRGLPGGMAPVVQDALGIVRSIEPLTDRPPERVEDYAGWSEALPRPSIEGSSIDEALSTIVDLVRSTGRLSRTVIDIETIVRDRDMILEAVDQGRTQDVDRVPEISRRPTPTP